MNSRATRNKTGSVLPFVALAMTVIVAYVGFSVDITRNFLAVRKIEFAADAAARYAYSFATNSDGTYLQGAAQSNIVSALADPNGSGGAAWNDAPAGPQPGSGVGQGPWNTDVTFNAGDANFVNNPADSSEILLQLTVHRTGSNALQNLFMPAIYSLTNFGGSAGPGSTVNPTRTVEVIGQPATRIGAGAPRTANGGARSLAGFATFPLAISNGQFNAATRTNGSIQYACDLVTSKTVGKAAAANHLKVCFINDASSGGTNPYYGQAQGLPAINQLMGLVKYFYQTATAGAVSPAAVERGSTVFAFDPADSTFTNQQSQLVKTLSQLRTNVDYIMPVISADPRFGSASTNQVIGFARVKLLQAVNTTGNIAFLISLDESVPMRNTACADGLATIPRLDGTTMMPPPVAPFLPRAYQPADNSVSPRLRGVVLAPCISPRIVTPS